MAGRYKKNRQGLQVKASPADELEKELLRFQVKRNTATTTLVTSVHRHFIQ